jgi:hypothetical protein
VALPDVLCTLFVLFFNGVLFFVPPLRGTGHSPDWNEGGCTGGLVYDQSAFDHSPFEAMRLTSLSPAKAAFVVLVLVLCAAAAVPVALLGYTGLQDAPPAGLIGFGYLLMLLSGVAAIAAGAMGSWKVHGSGSVANPYYVAFAVLYAVAFSTGDYPAWHLFLGWHIKVGAVGLGVNAVGVVLLIWHRKLVGSTGAVRLPADTARQPATP